VFPAPPPQRRELDGVWRASAARKPEFASFIREMDQARLVRIDHDAFAEVRPCLTRVL
jgi:hypothetical protein